MEENAVKHNLRAFIIQIYPNLTEAQLGILNDLFHEFGVDDPFEIQYIDADRIEATLGKAKARHLMSKAEATTSGEATTGDVADLRQDEYILHNMESPNTSTPPSVRSISPSHSSVEYQFDHELQPQYASTPTSTISTPRSPCSSTPDDQLHQDLPARSASNPQRRNPLKEQGARGTAHTSIPSIRRGGNTSTPRQSWVESFTFSLPSNVIRKIELSERNDKQMKREVVRLVMDQVMLVEPNPKKAELRTLAGRIAAKYQAMLDDDTYGRVMGGGFDGLTMMLVNKYDNLNRKRPDRVKRKATGEPASRPVTKKLKTCDSYGCIAFSPNFPGGETTESMEQMRVKLARCTEEQGPIREILDLLDKSYWYQRKEINAGLDASKLMDRWPALFTMEGLVAHLKLLTGENFIKNVLAAYDEKCTDIYEYFKEVSPVKTRKILEEIEEAKGETGNSVPLYAGLLVLMAKHFAEPLVTLLIQTEPTDCVNDVVPKLPETPAIVYCGSSPLTAKKFMMAADGCIVMQNINSFPLALALLFGMHFMLNTKYNPNCTATMDFFQRSFVNINPSTGSKSGNRRHGSGVHPKVTTFFSDMGTFLYTTQRKCVM